ncbi:hypothetical protein CEXT_736671 [Caerostris extrusa]|uniref:Uncharacterized protein n=1 Tax=Caerostris extrusa TaxID=172846 RepID=A0AAV4N2A8_CAEEX|nr:hypothetical protein CEXT_736671 [Caerostris extrusa]
MPKSKETERKSRSDKQDDEAKSDDGFSSALKSATKLSVFLKGCVNLVQTSKFYAIEDIDLVMKSGYRCGKVVSILDHWNTVGINPKAPRDKLNRELEQYGDIISSRWKTKDRSVPRRSYLILVVEAIAAALALMGNASPEICSQRG